MVAFLAIIIPVLLLVPFGVVGFSCIAMALCDNEQTIRAEDVRGLFFAVLVPMLAVIVVVLIFSASETYKSSKREQTANSVETVATNIFTEVQKCQGKSYLP